MSSLVCRWCKNKRPEPQGSGVLIHFSGRYFIVSAAHVFDDPKITYLIPLGAKQIEFDSSFVRKSPMPKSGMRRDDKLDIAAIELDEVHVKSLTDFGRFFLQVSDFALRHKDKNHRYGILGFVANRTKVSASIIDAMIFSYMATVPEKLNYRIIGLSEYYNFAIQYDGDVVSAQFPNPHKVGKIEGISGCGLWRIGDIVEADNLKLPFLALDLSRNRKLIGIVTEQHPLHKIIIATRIEVVIDFIISQFRLVKRKRPPLI